MGVVTVKNTTTFKPRESFVTEEGELNTAQSEMRKLWEKILSNTGSIQQCFHQVYPKEPFAQNHPGINTLLLLSQTLSGYDPYI